MIKRWTLLLGRSTLFIRITIPGKNSVNKRLFKYLYIALFITVTMVLVLYIFNLDRRIANNTLLRVGDELFVSFRNELEKQKSDALAFALTLAQNSALADALENDDEDAGYTILSNFMLTLEKYTPYTIRTQIITQDYCIFARSWDNSFAGMPIGIYRPDLLTFEANKQPKVAIEIGRRLGVKATVPVIKEGEVLGYVEVLGFFEDITEQFQMQKIDVIVLMEEQYLEMATLMRENPMIGDYVVANLRVNRYHIDSITPADMRYLRQNGNVAVKNFHYFYEPMLDGTGKSIGAFVLGLQTKHLEMIARKEESLSFFLNMTRNDLYAVVKNRQASDRVFKAAYDRDLIWLKDTVPAEDRELFLKEAHERLHDYTKEELIDMILGHSFSKRIEGEIR